jgi:hypothetical protein
MSTGATLIAQFAIAGEKASSKLEFAPPSYALRDMPAPSGLPEDEIGREIALLLWDHPDVAEQIGDVNLQELPRDAKRAMLDSIRQTLGISPIHRRRLGYVGP